MGIFGNLKKILFEDDDEDELSSMPTYTKEDVVETSKKSEVEKEVVAVEEPIRTSDDYHFSNVKRDIDFSYDEKDVLCEIPDAVGVVQEEKKVEERVQPKPEKKSVFPSFDEEEFERLNSRIMRNENKARREVNHVNNSNNVMNDARKANSNISATSMNSDNRGDMLDRYKMNESAPVKKTFTPSPIISPVYGILDKNYSKDDIVDKKGGIKREKIVKPVIKKEKIEKLEEPDVVTIEEVETLNMVVDIDSVRKKAYGGLDELEKSLTRTEKALEKESEVEIEIPKLSKNEEKILDEPIVEVKEILSLEDEVVEEEPSIEDQLEEKFTVDVQSIEDDHIELDKVVEDVIEKKKDNETSTKSNPKLLDDLEKTSTLQILDDIEKELNSIKPISKDVDYDSYEEDNQKNNNDTLEKDLFNLIDSMYVEGEEEEDD
jgi:hypothetical protein